MRDLSVWFVARALEALEGVVFDDALARAERALQDGSAADRLRAMIAAQSGDPGVVDDPDAVLPRAPVVVDIVADRTGTVASVDAEAIGLASGALGAGRVRKGGSIDPAVGIVVRPKIGDPVVAGEPIGEVHARDPEAADAAAGRVLGALDVTDGPAAAPPLVLDWLE
jgi:thymidine phosphorylase